MKSALPAAVWPATAVALGGLVLASLFVGGYDLTPWGVLSDPAQAEVWWISRVPRTLALIFAAMAMTISGVIMQMIQSPSDAIHVIPGTGQRAAAFHIHLPPLMLIRHQHGETLGSIVERFVRGTCHMDAI